MVEEKKDIKPALFKFGVALAISFAGFLYSRWKIRRAKSSKPPHSRHPSDDVDEIDDNLGRGRTNKGPGARISSENHQKDAYMPKAAVDGFVDVHSPSSRSGGAKDRYLLPEFNDLVNEFDLSSTTSGISPRKDLESPRSDMEAPRTVKSMEKDDCEQEIRRLKAVIKTLREREKSLEFQLLEFYGLKEQETAVMELQNRLKISNMETKLFTLKIESLQAGNQRLKEQAADHAKTVAELDVAKAKVKLLRKKLKSEAEQNREQILALQKRVNMLQEEELKAAANDSAIKLKLQQLKDLETEAEDLRKSNLRLNVENSELARQLESTKIIANSVLDDPETEELRELSNKLKQENESLAKEVERLHADRCNDCEELVYLRWVNACLRYELRNFQPEHGKTVARDLSKSLSPKSEEKAKQLILEYAHSEEMGEKGMNAMDFEPDQWSSSHTSYIIDSGDLDDSVSSPKTSNSNRIKIFNKLRRLIRGKDIHHSERAPSGDKTRGAEDSDSSRDSSSILTATDAASEGQYCTVQSPSPDLTRHFRRHSADIRGVKNPRQDEIKDNENGIGRRNSDIGSFYGHRRLLSGMSPENQLKHGFFAPERSELLKFAEVLKDSGNRTNKSHKRSTSIDSFAFRRSTSQ